jgi:hypothetical protein
LAPKLKLAPPPPPPPAPAPTSPTKFDKKKNRADAKKDVQRYIPQGNKRRKRARKISTFEIKVLPWLTFFLILLVFGWMRYVPGVLAPDIHTMFIQGGVWALLLLHVSVIFLAFGDDVFSGILCFIIPGYSIYYLFTQADQILLRGLVAALMIVFGLDFAQAAGSFWNDVYYEVSRWIATTDTVKKK